MDFTRRLVRPSQPVGFGANPALDVASTNKKTVHTH